MSEQDDVNEYVVILLLMKGMTDFSKIGLLYKSVMLLVF